MPSSKNARVFYRAASQRLDDARLLFQLKRTTAAVYLAGYGVECMLKALILSSIPRKQEEQILELFRGRQAHDYEWLMNLYRENGGTQTPRHLVLHYSRVNTWSTSLRYSPGIIEADKARAFLDSVGQIIQWAEGRL